MPRFYLSATLLLLFLLEGTVFQVFTPQRFLETMTLVPRFALVGAILVSFFLGRREGLFYGMALGFLHDVLFGNLIGVYTLSMMVASYFAGLIVKLFHRSPAVFLTTISIVLFGHEWLVYSLFRLFSIAVVDVQWVLTKQIIPNVIANVIFAIIVYWPMAKLCDKVRARREKTSE
ncbi:UNVERIFIED_CONTAM: rod shape-determining protein MreD [Brevibacillus sp. OAP136]